MPLYMDRHYIQGATRSAIETAHQKDLQLQDRYAVKFITYWFDEERSTAFCLVEAPNRGLIEHVHGEAHGSIPNEVIEVNADIVEAFLGRIKDPPRSVEDKHESNITEPAFRAIMFTDLKDSTQMTTQHGDNKALHLLHVHNALIRNALTSYLGREVKHTGDGIMASFSEVRNAVSCAIAIQQSFAAYNCENPDSPLQVRIGLSAGEPIEEHGDLYGTAVQLAARLCALTEAGTILAAQIVADECKGMEDNFLDSGEVTPKGFGQPIHVYEVQWSGAA